MRLEAHRAIAFLVSEHNWMVGPGAKKGGREKMRGLAKIIEALCFLVEMRKKPKV